MIVISVITISPTPGTRPNTAAAAVSVKPDDNSANLYNNHRIMRLGIWTIAMGVVAFAGASALAEGSAGERAKAAFERGTAAFAEERFAEAADAFREAHALKPSWKLFFNIGQCEAAGKRYGLALEAFERYLVEGGDEVSGERQEGVRAEIERLRGLVGFLKVTAPEGATVTVDGVERGVAPLARELPVAAAVIHAVRATRGGEVIAEERVQVGGGRTAAVELLPSAPTEPPAPEPSTPSTSPTPSTDPAPEPPVSSPLRTGGWVALGVGGALLVAGGVTGGLALEAKGDVEDTCPNGCYSDDYDLVDKRDNLALTTDILIGVGAAAAAAGIAMLVVDATGGEDEGTEISLAPGPGGILVRGRF